MAYANSTTENNVIGTNHVASSLNHSARVLIAGDAPAGRDDATPAHTFNTVAISYLEALACGANISIGNN